MTCKHLEKSLELSNQHPKIHPEAPSLRFSLWRLNSPSLLTLRKRMWSPKPSGVSIISFFSSVSVTNSCHAGYEKVSYGNFASEHPAFSCCLFAWHNMSKELFHKNRKAIVASKASLLINDLQAVSDEAWDMINNVNNHSFSCQMWKCITVSVAGTTETVMQLLDYI